MRRQRILFGLLLAVLLLPCSTTQAQPQPEAPAVTQTILHLEDQWLHAKTGEVVGTGKGDRRIYVVAFSDTFCLRRGQWLAVHAQGTLAPPPA